MSDESPENSQSTPPKSNELTEEALLKALGEMDALLKSGESPSELPGKHLAFSGKTFPRTDALKNLDLRLARFRDAELAGQDFGFSNVKEADFTDADLTDADLSKVTNLIPAQLSGADLTRCKLPADVAKFEALANVAELSRNAGVLFSILLVGCAFVLLVAVSTKDIQLLLDSGTATLPVINLSVPPRLFFGAAPWVLLGQYITMHLYLQRLWAQLATLPAIFPDGVTLDRKSYPWLLNDLIREGFTRLQKRPAALAATQLCAFRFLAYYLTPLVTLFLFIWSLKRQDNWLSIFQIFALTLLFFSMRTLYHIAMFTLQRNEEIKNLFGDWKNYPWHRETFYITIKIFLLLIIPSFFLPKYFPTYLWPWSAFIADDTTLLPDKFLIPKPLFVTPLKKEIDARGEGNNEKADFLENEREKQTAPAWEQLRSAVKSANLSNRNLRHLQAQGTFFANANFQSSSLEGAYLFDAVLTGADFREANLTGAYLAGANLIGADLSDAVLYGANLHEATLVGANLRDARLDKATSLETANLDQVLLALPHNGLRGTIWPEGWKLSSKGYEIVSVPPMRLREVAKESLTDTKALAGYLRMLVRVEKPKP